MGDNTFWNVTPHILKGELKLFNLYKMFSKNVVNIACTQYLIYFNIILPIRIL